MCYLHHISDILMVIQCRYGASIILKVVYGYDTMTKNDPFIAISNQFLEDIATSIKPGYLVEVFHWCTLVRTCFRDFQPVLMTSFQCDISPPGSPLQASRKQLPT